MKINRIPLLIVMILAATFSYGQDYAFKVLANKGNNEVKSGASWQPLKTGASLGNGDELKLEANAYVGLIHKNGKPLEIKNAGSYKVADLVKEMSGESSVLAKYTDFILSSNAENKKNRLSATGAVHRATENAAISVMLPDNQYTAVFGSTAVINWDGTTVAGPYVVTVKDLMDLEISKIETPETTVTLDLSDPKIAAVPAILVEVSSKADPKQASKRYVIKKLPPAEREKIKGDYNEIVIDVEEPSALNHYLLAKFYEQNNLYIDAIASYEAAVKMAPEVETYKEAYEDFLLTNGLKR
jgi:hypothetical protein